MAPCTQTLCPYAKWFNGTGVNRAAYSGYTTALAMINANSASTFKAASYAMASIFSMAQSAMPVRLRMGCSSTLPCVPRPTWWTRHQTRALPRSVVASMNARRAQPTQ